MGDKKKPSNGEENEEAINSKNNVEHTSTLLMSIALAIFSRSKKQLKSS